MLPKVHQNPVLLEERKRKRNRRTNGEERWFAGQRIGANDDEEKELELKNQLFCVSCRARERQIQNKEQEIDAHLILSYLPFSLSLPLLPLTSILRGNSLTHVPQFLKGAL